MELLICIVFILFVVGFIWFAFRKIPTTPDTHSPVQHEANPDISPVDSAIEERQASSANTAVSAPSNGKPPTLENVFICRVDTEPSWIKNSLKLTTPAPLGILCSKYKREYEERGELTVTHYCPAMEFIYGFSNRGCLEVDIRTIKKSWNPETREEINGVKRYLRKHITKLS